MATELGYDSGMRGRIAATVAVLVLVTLGMAATAWAQVNGVPASVTSLGFGGHFTPGVPASVTSLGPNGFRGHNPFFTQPRCCINPLFPRNSNSHLFRHHQRQLAFPVGVPVYTMPYTPVIIMQPGEDQVVEEEEENGGPTIFDRRGTGRYERERSSERQRDEREAEEEARSAPPQPVAPAAPVSEQAPTVLVFKDGHTVEVLNYAILGSLVYDLTPGHPRKIPLVDLDLAATAKQNDDRGIDFRLPAGPQVN
jgi:hypothetical protein